MEESPQNDVGKDICEKLSDDQQNNNNSDGTKDNNIADKKPKHKSIFTSSSMTSKINYNVAASPFVSSSSQKTSNHVPLAASSPNNTNVSSRIAIQPTAYQRSQSPILYNIPKAILRSTSVQQYSPTYYQTFNEVDVPRNLSHNFVYSTNPYSARLSRSQRTDYMDSARSFGPVALSNGTIQVRLREGIRVDMTLDQAVRVTNSKSRIAVSYSNSANSSALVHPNGRVYQYGSRVEIVTYDGMRNNNFVRYAKMWYKGVSFTSENCSLIYLVDTAGTRTTTDSFMDMEKDYTINVFLNDSRHGPTFTDEVMSVVHNCNVWYSEDGNENYDINDFRIVQTPDGLVKVSRTNNKLLLIRTSPGNGSVTLTTPYMHCTASLGQTSHLFVRRGERRMHFDGSSFVVRNAGHSAGFDDNNLLKVY